MTAQQEAIVADEQVEAIARLVASNEFTPGYHGDQAGLCDCAGCESIRETAMETAREIAALWPAPAAPPSATQPGTPPEGALETLVAACEKAFLSEPDCTGDEDNEDVSSPGIGITFGHVRRARMELSAPPSAEWTKEIAAIINRSSGEPYMGHDLALMKARLIAELFAPPSASAARIGEPLGRLIDRLRVREDDPDCAAAADGLEAERKQRVVDIGAFEARIAALEKALEPFAKAAEHFKDIPGIYTCNDNVELWQDPSYRCPITVGTLRHARSLLKEGE